MLFVSRVPEIRSGKSGEGEGRGNGNDVLRQVLRSGTTIDQILAEARRMDVSVGHGEKMVARGRESAVCKVIRRRYGGLCVERKVALLRKSDGRRQCEGHKRSHDSELNRKLDTVITLLKLVYRQGKVRNSMLERHCVLNVLNFQDECRQMLVRTAGNSRRAHTKRLTRRRPPKQTAEGGGPKPRPRPISTRIQRVVIDYDHVKEPKSQKAIWLNDLLLRAFLSCPLLEHETTPIL
ncbi:hypothetical protein V8F33_013824 [Rhypophila sp. PSN 637]